MSGNEFYYSGACGVASSSAEVSVEVSMISCYSSSDSRSASCHGASDEYTGMAVSS